MITTMPNTTLEPTSDRSYHDTKAAYILPNDSPEHARLEEQAIRLRDSMNGHIIHSPLDTKVLHKAVDIGCGTGAVTHDVASQFPKAHIIGLDLSPVPVVRDRLPNIEYIQGDFIELSDPDQSGPVFQPGTFDFVFSRLLILGNSNWTAYVDRCVSITKPGGWIEMHDIDLSIHRVPTPLTQDQKSWLTPHSLPLTDFSHPTDAWELPNVPWITTFSQLCGMNGMDIRCGRHLAQHFANAGLEDIRIKRYLLPFSYIEELGDEGKLLAEHHRGAIGSHLPDVVMKIGRGQDVVAWNEVEKAAAGAKRQNDEFDTARVFAWFYVVCGKKPSN